MDHIVNVNGKSVTVITVTQKEELKAQVVLKKPNVKAYSKALRRIQIQGGVR